MRGRAARCRATRPDAGGSRRRPACRHRAGVGRAACPRQRTRAAGRDSHVRGHGAHDAGDHLGGATFDPPLGPAGYARLLAPHRRPYATADGYLCLLIYNDKHWRNFRPDRPAGTGRRSALSQPWRARAHIGEVYAFVADVIRHRATDDWLADLARADIPAARLHAIEDLLDDEHLAATGFIRAQDHPPKAACARPRRWAATPARPPPSAAPPRAGPAQPRTAGGSRLRRGRHRRPVRARRRPFSRFPGTPGTPDGL